MRKDVDSLRRLLFSVGFGLFVTAFWIFGFGQDQWSGDFLGTSGGAPYIPSLVVFLCTTGIVSLIVFARQTHKDSREQSEWEARKQGEEEQRRRIAAIPQEIREKKARTNLELAQEAERNVSRARRQLRHQHDSISHFHYAQTEESLRLTADWISELVNGSSDETLASKRARDHRAHGEIVGNSLEDILTSIRSAELRLAEIDQTTDDYVGPQLAAAISSLGKAREWAEEALDVAVSSSTED